jgi:hypothetical protein
MSKQASLYDQIRIVDVVLMALFPLVIAGTYALPASTREVLVFEYEDPTLETAFASAFVHLDAAHFSQNLLLYALVILSVYALCLTARNRQQFRVFVVTVLIVFPFVLSYINLGIARSSVSFGASGLVMAFAGYLPLALAAYLEGNLGIGPVRTFAPLIFIPTLGLVSVLSLQSVIRTNPTALLVVVGLVAAALLATLWYAISAYERSKTTDWDVRNAAETPGGPELVGAASLVLLSILFVAFPADPTVEAGVVNLYEHFLGYSLGFIASFTTAEVTNRIDKAE